MNKKTNNKNKSANKLVKIKEPGKPNQAGTGELLEKLEDLNIISSLNSAINQGKSLKEIIKLFSGQTKKLFSGLGQQFTYLVKIVNILLCKIPHFLLVL